MIISHFFKYRWLSIRNQLTDARQRSVILSSVLITVLWVSGMAYSLPGFKASLLVDPDQVANRLQDLFILFWLLASMAPIRNPETATDQGPYPPYYPLTRVQRYGVFWLDRLSKAGSLVSLGFAGLLISIMVPGLSIIFVAVMSVLWVFFTHVWASALGILIYRSGIPKSFRYLLLALFISGTMIYFFNPSIADWLQLADWLKWSPAAMFARTFFDPIVPFLGFMVWVVILVWIDSWGFRQSVDGHLPLTAGHELKMKRPGISASQNAWFTFGFRYTGISILAILFPVVMFAFNTDLLLTPIMTMNQLVAFNGPMAFLFIILMAAARLVLIHNRHAWVHTIRLKQPTRQQLIKVKLALMAFLTPSLVFLSLIMIGTNINHYTLPYILSVIFMYICLAMPASDLFIAFYAGLLPVKASFSGGRQKGGDSFTTSFIGIFMIAVFFLIGSALTLVMYTQQSIWYVVIPSLVLFLGSLLGSGRLIANRLVTNRESILHRFGALS